ncbi:MAG: PorV/PorQ family protein [Candidatus Electryonea clarkiae]|nr:PorV/PorQ family protein [Candidatus Electryonea clarkiae]MDP8285867.1 PorV/PorQ family protein [Candidatus Electryonea clarkiae]
MLKGYRFFFRCTACLLVVMLIPGFVFAQAKVGTTGVNFLKIGVSARAVGMADAMLALSDDASTLFYNPGGMINLKNREMILSHVAYRAGLSFDFIGIVVPMPASGSAIGASITALYTDDMIETTPERPYGTGRTFTATDFSGGISYAQRLTDKFSVGGTVKYIQEDLADEVARGWGADVGTFYETGWKSMRIAMLISNFGPDMEFISTPFPLPLIFKFGVAADLIRNEDYGLLGVFEFTHPNDNVEEYHFGLEYSYNDFAMLRIGKKVNGWDRNTWDDFDADKLNNNPYYEYPVLDDGFPSFDGVSFGGGLKFRQIGLTVDYAYTGISYFGNIHRFSLGYLIK